MKIRNKRLFAVMVVLVQLLCSFQVSVNAADINAVTTAMETVVFEPELVTNALLFSRMDFADDTMASKLDVANYSAVISEVLQPTSMGITIPKIDSSRVAPINSKLLRDLKGYETFYEELVNHGYPKEVIEKMTYSEYEAIEATWPMSEEYIEVFKKIHPGLENEDLENWTIGESEEYTKEENIRELATRFTDEQLEELNERGILVEDTRYLFKEYHTADNILSKSDAALKNTLEGYYTFNIGMTLGFDVAEQLLSVDSGDVELMSSPTYTIPDSEAATNYEWVDFPKYGGDYFHNDVLTSAYWRNIQAYRTLLTESVLYAITYSPSNTLHCSNMFGTYSKSQRGAHEGIDFALDRTYRYVRSPVCGFEVQEGRKYHQQAIYDANHTDGPKTYSFYHLSSVEQVDEFYVGTLIGRQGAEGNADGVHVHFEVRSGRTTTLSEARDDHEITSLSPYRLTEYIGEAAQS